MPNTTEARLAAWALLSPKMLRGLMRMNSTMNRASPLKMKNWATMKPGSRPEGTRAVSEETSRAMLDLMRVNVVRGTGGKANAPGLRVGGKTGSAKQGKASTALEFLSMSKQQLAARYEVQSMGEETLWGGVATTHVKLIPKGGASFKWAEAWVDESGMPVQTKVIEKNDDSTSVRLTDLQRNATFSFDEFKLKIDSSFKIIPA